MIEALADWIGPQIPARVTDGALFAMFLAIVAVFYYLAGSDGAGKRLSDWKGWLFERLSGR